ncbi:MAG: hypothetical protein QM757_26640 [Paludibaculum sp.]
MGEQLAEHIDTEALRLAFEASTYRKSAKARRDYNCRFCHQRILAGQTYLKHDDRAAHPGCVERLAAMVQPVVSRER